MQNMSDGDRAIIREIAYEAANNIVEKVVRDLKEHYAHEIRLHIAECPVKQEVNNRINQVKGVRWALSLVAGLIGAAIGAAANILWK